MSDKKKCWVHYEAFEYGDEPPSDSHVEVPDTDALQARLATAERRLYAYHAIVVRHPHTWRAIHGSDTPNAEPTVEGLENILDRLTHLERLVEGLPVVEGEVTIETNCEGDWVVMEGNKDWRYPVVKCLSKETATALAALLTHRRGMTTPPPPASEKETR